MNSIFFITGNAYKFQIAQEALAGDGIELIQKELETPEIQSISIEEIASFSANWASNLLKESVIVSDAGYYIEAFNGFPGPFIKYINKSNFPAPPCAGLKRKEKWECVLD